MPINSYYPLSLSDDMLGRFMAVFYNFQEVPIIGRIIYFSRKFIARNFYFYLTLPEVPAIVAHLDVLFAEGQIIPHPT